MIATTREAERLMFAGSLAMADMSHAGIKIDMQELEKQITQTDEEIKKIQAQLREDEVWSVWRKTFGSSAAIGSKAQLSTVIFDKMGHKRPKATAKKFRSDEYAKEKRESKYDEATFQDVDLKFVKRFFRCEKLKKLSGTYLTGIKREVCEGYVHPDIKLHSTVSYRPSTTAPNLANIPKRNKEIAQRILGCFIAREGRRLIIRDFKQAEVCVSACYNRDANLIKYISDKSTDMHRDLAATMFGVPVETMIKYKEWAKETIRDWAKNRMTFPQFYGSVYFQCAPSLWKAVLAKTFMHDGKTRVSDHLAKQGITQLGNCEPGAAVQPGTWVHRVKESEDYLWHTMFHEFTAWKRRWHRKYLKRGYFDSLTGFRYTGLFKRNDVLNYATQGTAWHCALQVIIWTQEAIRKYKMRTKLVNEVYDSMMADVPDEEVQDYLDITHELITERLPKHWPWIIVPMSSDSEVSPIGGSWRDVAEWTKVDGVWGPARKG